MALELVVGGAVGAGVVYVWIWKRFAGVRAFFRAHKRASAFERGLRAAREDMTVPQPYRAATADDRELVGMLAAAESETAALVAIGFTGVGEIIVVGANSDRVVAVRGLVDRAQTTSAILLVSRKQPVAMLQLMSFVGEHVWTTRRGKLASLADPPTVHRQALATDLSLAELVTSHASFVTGEPTPIATRDELIVALNASRATTTRWRSEQSPDALLDADLRIVLGDVYDRSGKIWNRRLRGRLPQATLRR